LELIPSWLEGLAKEVELEAPAWPEGFDTVYFGGGSPSILSRLDLEGLFAALKPFRITADAEVTLEANPQDVTPDKVEQWHEFGINRISLGVQSFEPRWLNVSLERVHTPADNLTAIVALESRGLRLSLDMIYGHPAQEPEEWVGDLDRAAATGAEHISAYVLTPAPGTPLGRAVAERQLRLPGEQLIAEMFLLTEQAMSIRGFSCYEVSNFARGGAVCRHNLKYWNRTPYLGLGPSAHSFDGRFRRANVASVRRWISQLSAGRLALEFTEEIDEEKARIERIMLGLRLTEGLDADLVKSSRALDGYLRDGYLHQEGGRLKPAPKGLLIADAIARSLI
jgi:oxygen-independent coproporphyrinogen-3 oxidase